MKPSLLDGEVAEVSVSDLVATAANPTCTAPAQRPCAHSCSCQCAKEQCEPWQIGGSWLMLRRVVDHGPVFLTPTQTAVVLNANEFNTDYRPGFELTARGRMRGVLTDIRYFQLDNLDEESRRVIPSPVFFTGAGLAFANPVQVAYNSDLYSAEFNLLTDEINDVVRWLAGFRYLQYNEKFSLRTANGFAASAETENQLYGFQIGAEVNLLRTDAWEFRGYVKTGIYFADQQSRYLETIFDLRDEEDAAAFVGELGLTGRYCLSKNWALDAGYRVLWLDGLAVAGEQFSTTSIVTQTSRINQGDVILHGFNLGLTYTF